jgi:magnesium transporter
VTLRLKEIICVERLHKLTGTARLHLYEKGVGHFVYRYLDEILLSYFAIMDRVEERIDAVEVRVFRRPERPTAKEIFSLKKILIYFHKALAANREVVTAIEKEYLKQIPKKDQKKFRNLYNDVVELLDLTSTYRDILTGTLDVYLSTVSNNLNHIMKKLTALASFVLIPTLITGIYGMNFAVMPELNWRYGYFMALGLMIFSVALLYMYFKKKDWI